MRASIEKFDGVGPPGPRRGPVTLELMGPGGVAVDDWTLLSAIEFEWQGDATVLPSDLVPEPMFDLYLRRQGNRSWIDGVWQAPTIGLRMLAPAKGVWIIRAWFEGGVDYFLHTIARGENGFTIRAARGNGASGDGVRGPAGRPLEARVVVDQSMPPEWGAALATARERWSGDWVPVKGGPYALGCRSDPTDCSLDDPPRDVEVASFEVMKHKVSKSQSEWCRRTNECVPLLANLSGIAAEEFARIMWWPKVERSASKYEGWSADWRLGPRNLLFSPDPGGSSAPADSHPPAPGDEPYRRMVRVSEWKSRDRLFTPSSRDDQGSLGSHFLESAGDREPLAAICRFLGGRAPTQVEWETVLAAKAPVDGMDKDPPEIVVGPDGWPIPKVAATARSPSSDGLERLGVAAEVGIRCVRGAGYSAAATVEEQAAAEQFSKRWDAAIRARAARSFAWVTVPAGSYPVPAGDTVKLVKLDRFKVSRAPPSRDAKRLCERLHDSPCDCVGARKISFDEQMVLATRNVPTWAWMVGENGRLDEGALERRLEAFKDRCVKHD